MALSPSRGTPPRDCCVTSYDNILVDMALVTAVNYVTMTARSFLIKPCIMPLIVRLSGEQQHSGTCVLSHGMVQCKDSDKQNRSEEG
jgi:hypothetical protein